MGQDSELVITRVPWGTVQTQETRRTILFLKPQSGFSDFSLVQLTGSKNAKDDLQGNLLPFTIQILRQNLIGLFKSNVQFWTNQQRPGTIERNSFLQRNVLSSTTKKQVFI